MMVDKDDLRRVALSFDGVTESAKQEYAFDRDGRMIIRPYPEKVHPKKPRVTRFDQYVMRVENADDKEACLQGEPEIFFTTDHYNGYATVIVRLDAIDEERLREIVEDAWMATPSKTRLDRTV